MRGILIIEYAKILVLTKRGMNVVDAAIEVRQKKFVYVQSCIDIQLAFILSVSPH